jgi:transcriptional regulator with XRE-family HTH domain
MGDDKAMVQIGARILEYRKAANMSQEEFASRIGVSRQAVSKWELDKASPDLDKLVDICEVLGITLDELIYGKKENTNLNAALEENGAQGIHPLRDSHVMRLCILAFLILFTVSGVVWVTSLIRNGWSRDSYDRVYARVERVYNQYTKADISYTDDEGRRLLETVWLDMDGVRDGDYIACYTNQNTLFVEYNKSTLIIPGVFTLVAFCMLILLLKEQRRIRKEAYTQNIKENGEDEE